MRFSQLCRSHHEVCSRWVLLPKASQKSRDCWFSPGDDEIWASDAVINKQRTRNSAYLFSEALRNRGTLQKKRYWRTLPNWPQSTQSTGGWKFSQYFTMNLLLLLWASTWWRRGRRLSRSGFITGGLGASRESAFASGTVTLGLIERKMDWIPSCAKDEERSYLAGLYAGGSVFCHWSTAGFLWHDVC